jgi:superfamily II DNA or RNA helicase
MVVLHASEEGGYLLLWAESGAPPFTLRASELEKLLRPWASETLRGLAWERSVTLPTVGGQPVPSTPRLGAMPEGTISLTRHTVATIPFDLPEMLGLLRALPDDLETPLAAGIWVGQSLPVWAAVDRFARSLVIRHQVVPTVVQEDSVWIARWRAALLGDDATRLAALAKALPSAARALTVPDALPSPADAAVRRVLDRFVDHRIRPSRRSSSRRVFESAHDAFLHALQTGDGVLALSSSEAAALAGAVSGWEGPLQRMHAAPLRLCFRLEEPEAADTAPWRVRFLLRPVSDPSLLVDAKDIWGNRHTLPHTAREFLLQALAEAARLCPEIAQAMRRKDPSGFPISGDDVLRFLTEQAPLLESAGFVVMLPAWWVGKRPKLTVSAAVRTKFKTASGLSLDTVIAFDPTLTLDGEPLTDAERERLVRAKVSLVRLRGKWVQIDAQGLDRARVLWEKSQKDAMTVRDLVHLTLGAETLPGELALGRVQGDGELGMLLERLTGERPLEPVPTPDGFIGRLRPYQERGFAWLVFLTQLGLGACLADDMGLGKTAQTIALLVSGKGPYLLVCPTSVLGNWERELARFAPSLRVLTHHGPMRQKGDALQSALSDADILLTSYALLHRDGADLRTITFAGAILDEAQNIKNPESRQSQAARSLNARWRIALTGTPVENHVGDLWALFAYLNPGLLGSERAFKRTFFTPIQQEHDVDAVAALKQRVGPLILRRVKTDRSVIADLPDKIEQEEHCPLTPEQATLYEAVLVDLERGLTDAEGMARRGLVLATLTRLKQVCNHPAHYLDDGTPLPARSGKLTRLEELIEALLASEESVLIFSQFATFAERLAIHLRQTFGRETLYLSGQTAKKERDALVARFQTEKGPPIFVLSLKAGGVGLNLTRASRVIHFDRWWNPAVEDQATDRAFRIGQQRNVFVHKFVCRGTVEERIATLIGEKRAVAGQVIGAGEGWLTELSTAELKTLFALSRERALQEV